MLPHADIITPPRWIKSDDLSSEVLLCTSGALPALLQTLLGLSIITSITCNRLIQCLLFQGLKTASFFYPGGGANYSGQAVHRAVLQEVGHPDDNETEWRENIDKVMSWFSEEDFHLVTLYYGEPDNVGHAKGPDHPDRKEIIRQIDRTIGYLRAAIDRHNLTDSLNVIISSDHGMTTVKKRPQVDEVILNKYLDLLKHVSFEILDYGGFGILTPRPGQEQQVYDALSNVPNVTVYKKDEIPKSFHLGRSARLPPIVVIADLGFNLNSVSTPRFDLQEVKVQRIQTTQPDFLSLF